MKKRYLKYVIRIQYLGGFEDDFNEKDNWYRDFEVCSEITLENLNSIIQKILNWDDSHLYLFAIKGVK